jgi:phosphatidylglycerol---prolipoprotein diacylglyceryl transferase
MRRFSVQTPLAAPDMELFPDNTTFLILGPLVLRWYALAYMGGLVIGWRWMRVLAQKPPVVATPVQVDEFLTWATVGVVLGGRLGYVLFYQPSRYLSEPFEIFAVWQGGMSFHGGMAGTALATLLYCRRAGISLWGFADRLAVVAPAGLFLGRLANFANGELWGREAPPGLPWAMRFPGAGDVLRHPSQLYQAMLEGLVLLVVMVVLSRKEAVRARLGLLTGVFLVGYAIARMVGELFRQPDPFLGFLYAGATMGQLLSLPMLAAGLVLIARAR